MKGLVIIGIIVIMVVLGFFIFNLTGSVIESFESQSFGPSAEEQICMMSCMGCSSPGVNCTGDSEKCQVSCNAKKPEETSEEKCVSDCVKKGCGEFDFECQKANHGKCDKECGMIKEPEATSAEETCIRECVKKSDPNLMCQASQEGEAGNNLCKECAKSCEYLYEGPCLDDKKLKAKQKDCETCEHCYGEPVMGDSGEGWECIVSVECKDASSEFGDEPGTGPGVGQEGFVANVGNAVGNIVESIGNFFSGLFGGGGESIGEAGKAGEEKGQGEAEVKSEESSE